MCACVCVYILYIRIRIHGMHEPGNKTLENSFATDAGAARREGTRFLTRNIKHDILADVSPPWRAARVLCCAYRTNVPYGRVSTSDGAKIFDRFAGKRYFCTTRELRTVSSETSASSVYRESARFTMGGWYETAGETRISQSPSALNSCKNG